MTRKKKIKNPTELQKLNWKRAVTLRFLLGGRALILKAKKNFKGLYILDATKAIDLLVADLTHIYKNRKKELK